MQTAAVVNCLNEFLRICGKEESVPGQSKNHWEALSMQRKNVYCGRATTAMVAALEVITPGDVGICGKLCNLHSVETALGMNEKPADEKYLKALAPCDYPNVKK